MPLRSCQQCERCALTSSWEMSSTHTHTRKKYEYRKLELCGAWQDYASFARSDGRCVLALLIYCTDLPASHATNEHPHIYYAFLSVFVWPWRPRRREKTCVALHTHTHTQNVALHSQRNNFKIAYLRVGVTECRCETMRTVCANATACNR